MPFDATTETVAAPGGAATRRDPLATVTVPSNAVNRRDPLAEQRAELALYVDRRRAAIALWSAIPPRQFDLRAWVHPCGTVACAIGWLAIVGHDGWEFCPSPRVGGSRAPFHAPTRAHYGEGRFEIFDSFLEIGLYFGLYHDEAQAIFGNEHAYVVAGYTLGLPVRPEHVARALDQRPVSQRANILSYYKLQLLRPTAPGLTMPTFGSPLLSLLCGS